MLKTFVITDRTRNIVIAVAAAAFAAMLTLFYVSNYKRHVQEAQKNVPVLVAKSNIPSGTLGTEVLAKKLAVVRQLPRASVAPSTFSSAQQVKSMIAADPIYAGEQVTARRFRPRQERGVRAELKGNLRAMQVPGDQHQLLAGTLNSGDHVDVVANFKEKIRGGDEIRVTRVVLRDILVLRGPSTQSAGGGVGTTAEEYSVQLAVTDNQSQKLFFAMKNGDWTLDLRSVGNAADSPQAAETDMTMVFDGLSRAQIRKMFTGGLPR